MFNLYDKIQNIDNDLLRAFTMSCYMLLLAILFILTVGTVVGMIILVTAIGSIFGLIGNIVAIMLFVLILGTVIFYISDLLAK